MKVYLVYDKRPGLYGYPINHGIFSSKKLAEEFIETESYKYDEEDRKAFTDGTEIEEFILVKK